MPSLRRQEGYLVIDHRNSPGIDPHPDLVARFGTPAVPAGTLYESATITCSHCHTVVVLNPQRTRSRGYCGKCDHFVCDGCETIRVKTNECLPLTKVFDVLQNQAEKAHR